MSARSRNIIKTSFDKITLSGAAKRRIVAACSTDAAPAKGRSFRAAWAAAAAVFLVAVMTVGTLAAVGVFRKGPGVVDPHVDTTQDIEFNPIVVDLSRDEDGALYENEALSDDGQYVLKFNSLTGSEEKIYIDCTLTRKDGGVITDVRTDEGALPQLLGHGMLYLSDGSDREVFFYALSDSSETEYHMEGGALMSRKFDADFDSYDEYRDNKYYSAEEIDALLDGAKVIPGGFKLRADNTSPIPFAKEDLGKILEGYEPDDAYPLEERGLNTPLSADGSVVIDNFAFAPYIRSGRPDSMQALYLNLKGYTGDCASFKTERKDGSPYYGMVVVGKNAQDLMTVVIFSDTQDVTPYDLENITGISEVRHYDDIICGFSSELSVKGGFKNVTLEVSFDPVEVVYDNGKIVLNRAYVTNTDLRLFGHNEGEGECIGLGAMCDAAYVVTVDGERVMLGTKGAGGNINGEFMIGWQCATALDPETIASIHIGDAVITLK